MVVSRRALRTAGSLTPTGRQAWCLSRAVAIAMALTLVVGACGVLNPWADDTAHGLSTTSIDDQEARRAITESYRYTSSEVHPLPTSTGEVWVLSTSRPDPHADGEHTDVPTITIVGSSAEDDSVQWALTVEEARSREESLEYVDDPQEEVRDLMAREASGNTVVSPDGTHISIMLRSRNTVEGSSDIAHQRTRVMVLEAASGRVVRTEEVAGLVLGQVLTNDSLAVETAQDFFPGGQGNGLISVFPILDPQAGSTSFPTDQWLVGGGQDSLLLSPRSQVEPSSEIRCSGWCLITTLTQVTTSGQELGRITGVTAIYPGGWVLRYTNPQEAAALAEREAPVPSRERESFIDTWDTLSQEVTDIDSGASADVTGMDVKPHRVPTGPGLLVTRPGERTEEGNIRTEPVFWLSAADDGAPHTEGLEAFEK